VEGFVHLSPLSRVVLEKQQDYSRNTRNSKTQKEVHMPRIDDYKQALSLAKEELLQKNPKRLADQGKGNFIIADKGPVLEILFLNKWVQVEWKDLCMTFKSTVEEVPIQQQVLIAHYLNGLKGMAPEGQWISYQDIPDGRFYMDAFVRRAKRPLVEAFGMEPDLLLRLAKELYNAKEGDQGDASVIVEALPHVPIMLVIWRGDEEFPPEGTILFDTTIKEILSAEDIAWVSGMVVYPLVANKVKKGG
jgi:hypothetical protein